MLSRSRALERLENASSIDEIQEIIRQLDASGPSAASLYLFYSGNLGDAVMQNIAARPC